MTRRFLRMAIVLGLITAVGPFAIDMYLPALPSMGKSLQAGPGAVQMSLMVFFIVIGVCQLFYGPLSDIVGRKLPIYGGLAIFAVGSIGCALAPGINILIAFRVIQAFGACAGMVIPRAIVRDLHTGHDATRLMSLLMLTVSISPILAPLTGSFVIAAFGWRGVFAVLTIAAVLALLLAATQLKETRPPEHRGESSWRSAFSAYGLLLRDREFTGLVLVGALGVSSFFVYLGSASFVLINYYGLTPKLFSLCFALNAASFFGFSQLTGMLTQKFGLPRVIRVAASGFALAMLALAVLFAMGVEQPHRPDGAALHRLRLSGPGDPHHRRPGAGTSWRHRRHGFGADGLAPDDHRIGDHGAGRSLRQRNAQADGVRHRRLRRRILRRRGVFPAARLRDGVGHSPARLGPLSTKPFIKLSDTPAPRP